MLRVHHVAGLAAVLLGTGEPDLDRAADIRLEGVALDPGQQLAEQRGIHPVDLFVTGARRAHEVEQVDDARARLTRVMDEGMAFVQPAHRHVAAVA